jgi:hypothetical protein
MKKSRIYAKPEERTHNISTRRSGRMNSGSVSGLSNHYGPADPPIDLTPEMEPQTNPIKKYVSNVTMHTLQVGWDWRGGSLSLPPPPPYQRQYPHSCRPCLVHKITNLPVFFIWSLDFMILKWATSITRAIGTGGPAIFRAHPFQWPSKWMLPTSKSFCTAPYKQQVH